MRKKHQILQWGIALAGGVLALRLGANIIRLWKAGAAVKEAQEAVAQAKIENANLQKKLAEVQTPEFIERQAREKLGYGREGETLLILPDLNANPNSQTPARPAGRPNPNDDRPSWKQWWDLYIRI